jgi:hypothetical protein
MPNVLIAVTDIADVNESLEALVALGLRNPRVLTSIGVITGSVPAVFDLTMLKTVNGVTSVEYERTVDVPSPVGPNDPCYASSTRTG